jgi:hypothetical protein
MSIRTLALVTFSLISAAGCRTDESTLNINDSTAEFSVEIDALAMSEVEGIWSGELHSVHADDSLGLQGAEVLTILRVLEYDADAAEVDMSFRFDLDEWMTGIGTAGLMSNEIGDFEAVVRTPDGVTCMVDGDWSTGTQSVYVEFICTDTDGISGEYLLEAHRF